VSATAMSPNLPLSTRRLVAEFLGTFILIIGGVGTAVVGIQTHGTLAVAIAFGLVLTLGVYAFGPVSGCHVNPAVTLGMLMRGKIARAEAIAYWGVQFAAGIVGAGVLKLMVSQFGVKDETGALGTNNYGTNVNLAGALCMEALVTAVFVLIILMVTDRVANAAMAGVAIGAALTLSHLILIPLTGTSVNPARSLGPALFNGGDSLKHVWVFILAPLVGGAVAALVFPFTKGGEE